MLTIRRLSALLPALAACGGQPAGAQPPAPVAEGLASSDVYEVATLQAAMQEVPPFIEVSGFGSVDVSPDIAEVSFATETRSADATAAAADNARVMDAVIRALRATDAAGLEIETFGYALTPQYSVHTVDGVRTRVVDGYMVVNHVRTTVADVEAVGGLIDTAIGAGANRVAALDFRASDTEAARREALTRAVTEARQQAEAIAAALDRELGAPLEVRGGSLGEPRFRMTRAAMASSLQEAAPTPIEAQDETVSANVTIKFALGAMKEG